jgi:hypothetical protein
MAGLIRRWARRLFEWRAKPKSPEEPRYKHFERRGEEIYDEMYETSGPRGYLSEIKECFEAAIAAAESDGLTAEARRLRARLDHIVEGYRRYFS